MASLVISGDTSGSITLAAPAVAGSNTLTLPVVNDTLAGLAATQTLSNKIVQLVAGSATVPSLTNVNNTLTGLYFPAANVIATTTAGSERVRVDASGNMGIGTTSPDALLTVNGVASFGDGTVTAPSIAHSGDLNCGLYFPAVDTIGFTTGGAEHLRIDSTGNVIVTSATVLGYGTGSGGSNTQTTSRTTGVTINNPTGNITLVSAAGTSTWQSFTVTNSKVLANDTVIVNQKSGTDLYQIFVTNVAAGSFKISFATTGGTTTEQPVFNFSVIKGSTT